MVTSIKSGLFSGCVSLEKVNIPEGVTTIGQQAFRGCTSLKEITIPKSLSHISYDAFENCRIEKITIKNFNGYNSLKNTLKYSLKEAVISDVTEISTSSYNGAFEGFNMLEKVNIPEGVTTIEDEAFRGCTSLKEITIPKTVTSIENGAFEKINEGAHFTVGSEAVKNILITDHNISADKITVK